MILNVTCGDRQWFAETGDEISSVVAEAMGSLQGWNQQGEHWFPGTTAWFAWSDRRHMDRADMPNNFLVVSINKETGYGGLIWFVNAGYPGPETDEVLDNIWVSDNPNPPDFDPGVVSNPDEPYWFDLRSTLPAEQIEAAVEEFCRVRTGIRPECVQWTLGEVSGRRAVRDL
ncbi:Imm1 family immunity protein [Actinacidiphila glaucinigra]|uniref:Imm1 family immunity protein n=1 Tax=Actinacidiphila glaucinigra TaxID=235986 RepID=UPI002DD7B2E2|nr:Imm1 family immunity protein [Actinacidiphila glaucinigra]WSD61631.1 Imm1 family immunity protein [Actinacidiphila glaucinigra]